MTTKISQQLVKDLFEYQQDGTFIRKVSTSNRVKVGDKVGWNTINGKYLGVCVNGTKQLMHRMIFLYHYGYLPENIDHIDGNGTNNRIENLRAASFRENMLNRKGSGDSKSGVKGVYWSKSSNKWAVHCSVNKKIKYFGVYDDIELAELVAIEVRNKYHGKFANHMVTLTNE
jgi:hypothetical protein